MPLSARRAAHLVASLLAVAAPLAFGLAACAAGEDAAAGTSDTALTVPDAGKGHDAGKDSSSGGSSGDSSGGSDAGSDPTDATTTDLDATDDAATPADAGDDAPVDNDAGADDAAPPPPPPPPPPVDSGASANCPNNPSYDLTFATIGFIPGATTKCSAGCTSSQCCYTTQKVCLPK